MANLTLEQIEKIASRPYHMCVLTSPEERDALCEMARQWRIHLCPPNRFDDLAKLRAVRDAAKAVLERLKRVPLADVGFVHGAGLIFAMEALEFSLAAAEDVK